MQGVVVGAVDGDAVAGVAQRGIAVGRRCRRSCRSGRCSPNAASIRMPFSPLPETRLPSGGATKTWAVRPTVPLSLVGSLGWPSAFTPIASPPIVLPLERRSPRCRCRRCPSPSCRRRWCRSGSTRWCCRRAVQADAIAAVARDDVRHDAARRRRDCSRYCCPTRSPRRRRRRRCWRAGAVQPEADIVVVQGDVAAFSVTPLPCALPTDKPTSCEPSEPAANTRPAWPLQSMPIVGAVPVVVLPARSTSAG